MKITHKKINGWQRLYLVALVLFYLPMLVYLTTLLDVPKRLTQQKLIEILPSDIQTMTSKPNGLEISAEIKPPPAALDPKNIDTNSEAYKSQLDRDITNLRLFGYTVVFGGDSWSAVISYPAFTTEEEAKKIHDDVGVVLDREYMKQSIFERVIFFLKGLFFAAFVYLVGLGLGWVVKGFREQ